MTTNDIVRQKYRRQIIGNAADSVSLHMKSTETGL